MGKKIPLVSFLCGALARKKTPPSSPVDGAAKSEDSSESSSSGGDAAQIQKDAATIDSPDDLPRDADQFALNDLQQPLPPPPGGGQHMRTASCHHQHQRSNSITSKLVSSMSMRVLGSGGAGVASFRREEKPRKEKKLKQEDSIWKKTIILGEKCRPDEDEDSILYDENGKRIAAYHPKGYSGVLSMSRQTTGASASVDQEELSRK